MAKKTPAKKSPVSQKTLEKKINNLKISMLYVLVGGLIIAALISITAILLGEFNDVIKRALLTTFVVMSHCFFILLIVLADTNNRIGKSLILTTFVGTIFANLFTFVLGIWGIWTIETSWDFVTLYALILGLTFLAEGVSKLFLKTRSVIYAVSVTLYSIVLFGAIMTPWIFADSPTMLDDFYYRLVSASTVLVASSLTLSVILNRIAVSRNPALAVKKTAPQSNGGGLQAFLIILGIVISIWWLYGIVEFIGQASAQVTCSVQALDTPYTAIAGPSYCD